jgi:tRNA(Arg) A34 adenosine deaminase TadA
MPKHADTDIAYVARTIEQACAAVSRGDYPFAAIAVGKEGDVLFEGTNICARSGDPTDHAEMHVLRAAERQHGIAALNGATLYVNAEPCSMCAGTILRFGIGRVVYATAGTALRPYLDENEGFKSYPSGPIFAVAGHDIEVIGGLLADRSIEPFELWAQRKGLVA